MTANISKKTRRDVYRRDGYRCALCDSTTVIQIHHVIPRGQGGKGERQNLITLCSTCHAQAHGHLLTEQIDACTINQLCVEYLADFYAPFWNPWEDGRHP